MLDGTTNSWSMAAVKHRASSSETTATPGKTLQLLPLDKTAAETPLGEDNAWPQSLRRAVDFIRQQPLAMAVLWGPAPTVFLNDAGRDLLAGPEATAPEHLPIDRATYDKVLAGSSLVHQALLPVTAAEGESRHLDVALGPIRGETQDIEGAIATFIAAAPRNGAETAEPEVPRNQSIGAAGMFSHGVPVGPELSVSDRWLEILGLLREDLPPWQEFASWFEDRVHPDDRGRRHHSIDAFVDGDISRHEAEYRLRDRAGEWTWVREVAEASKRDAKGRVVQLTGVIQDITKRKVADLEARRQAHHDKLTGLPDRSLFRDGLTRALHTAADAGAALGLILVNLDRFSAVNEEFGHEIGDRVLRAIADRLSREQQEASLIARLGDDEFVVMAPQLGERAEAESLALRLREAVARPTTIDGNEIAVTACIGVAIFPDDGRDATTLLRSADFALRKAQEIGRDEVYLFDPVIIESYERRRSHEADLRRAIDDGEMVLHYQPIFDVKSGETCAVEALVRWQRSEAELLLPRHFMPLAKESGLVLPLGRWILEETARQIAAWAAEGLDLKITVNVSHAEAARPEFLTAFDRATAASGIAADRFDFEIDHTILVDHGSLPVQNFLAGCRARGVQLVMDDYGVGYSSTGYMQGLALDKVKIDRTFVAGAGRDDPGADDLLSIMCEEGHRLARRVVAEGVETPAQIAMVRQVGCDEVQGNLLCPAGPPSAVFERLLNGATNL